MATNINFEDWLALTQLYADYASAVDSGDWDLWPEFFTDDCIYRLQPRENHERGFPLATLSFSSKGMLKDRVYGITQTLFHQPYYQRHLVSGLAIAAVEEGAIAAEANYLVIRTRKNEPSEVFNCGRYFDRIVREGGALKFREKLAVFDSELIPNSIIYPI